MNECIYGSLIIVNKISFSYLRSQENKIQKYAERRDCDKERERDKERGGHRDREREERRREKRNVEKSNEK